MDDLTKPLFLGRLSHEQLTSNQMVGQWIRSFARSLLVKRQTDNTTPGGMGLDRR